MTNWIVEIGLGAAIGIAIGFLTPTPKIKSGPRAFLWIIRAGVILFFALLTWDRFVGGNKAEAALPIILGLIIVSGICVIIDQLEEIRRVLKEQGTGTGGPSQTNAIHSGRD